MGKKLIMMLLVLLALAGCGEKVELSQKHNIEVKLFRLGWLKYDYKTFMDSSWKVVLVNNEILHSSSGANIYFKDGVVSGYDGCNEFEVLGCDEDTGTCEISTTLLFCLIEEYRMDGKLISGQENMIMDQGDKIRWFSFGSQWYKFGNYGKIYLRTPNGEIMFLTPIP